MRRFLLAAILPVAVLPAGRYRLLVHDLSTEHNFVLGSKSTGERLVDSGVEFVGDLAVPIELVPGRYAYACSPHFETMNGHLAVVAAPQATRSLTATLASQAASWSAERG